MLIGIISDTHDNANNLLKAIELFNEREVGLVIHCGDWCSPFMPNFCSDLKCKIVSVFGNNEGDVFRFLTRKEKEGWNIEFYSDAHELEIDGKKIVIYHGNSKILLDALLASIKYDLIISGHNHAPSINKINQALHINPGTACGIVGSQIMGRATVAFYDSKTNEAQIIDL